MDRCMDGNIYSGTCTQINEWPDDLHDLRLYPLSTDPLLVISSEMSSLNYSDDKGYGMAPPEKQNASYQSFDHNLFYDRRVVLSDDTIWQTSLRCLQEDMNLANEDPQYTENCQEHSTLRTPLHPLSPVPLFPVPHNHRYSGTPAIHTEQRTVTESHTSNFVGASEAAAFWKKYNYSRFAVHSASTVPSGHCTTSSPLSAGSSYDSFREDYQTTGSSPQSSDYPDKPAGCNRKRNRLPKIIYDKLTEKEKSDRKKLLNNVCSAKYLKKIKERVCEAQKESHVQSDKKRALTHEKDRLERQVKIMCETLGSLGHDFQEINLNCGFR